MKKLANLKGVKALNKNEQKSINGGGGPFIGSDCITNCSSVCNPNVTGAYGFRHVCVPCEAFEECRIF